MKYFALLTFLIFASYLLGFYQETRKIPVDGQKLYNSD